MPDNMQKALGPRRMKMSEVKYGQLASWDDADVSSQSDFMDLKEGDNLVRVITERPYQFVIHWVKDATGTNRKVRCAIDDCPLCRKGNKAQCRWYLGVLDRRTNLPKILEISSQVYMGIKNYVASPKWGDVRRYDINIKRAPKGTQPLYSVVVEPPEPLSEKDKEMRAAFLERVDINKFTQPATPEEILEKIGDAPQTPPARQSHGSNRAPAKVAPPPKVDDDDYDFGDGDDL